MKTKKGNGFACGVGALAGVALGVVAGLVFFYWFFQFLWSPSSGRRTIPILELVIPLVMLCLFLLLLGLSGSFVARRTGRGAGVGALCGLIQGPVTIIITAIILIACCFIFLPTSGGSGDALGWSIVLIVWGTIALLIASLVVGPLTGALGGAFFSSRAKPSRDLIS